VLGVLSDIGTRLAAPDEETARRAGRLRFAAGSDDGVDALVAAAALGAGARCVVLTSDPDDLTRLLAAEPSVLVVAV